MTSDELKKLLDDAIEKEAKRWSDPMWGFTIEQGDIKVALRQGAKFSLELLWPLVEALEFYGDEKVNYYMRNDSLDEDGKEDGFVNWTDREVDRGNKARQTLTDLKEKLKGG